MADGTDHSDADPDPDADADPDSDLGPNVDIDGELCKSLTRAAEPLNSTEPDAPVDYLDVIGESIADSDVIGMGEASHGTREFFQFKHRLFRYLVEKHGFRMLGLEANFAALLDVNDYVVRGEVTGDATLSTDYIHRAYKSKSILELVEWIRGFNEGRPRADRVRLHGIDVQFPSIAAAKLESYLDTVDPAALADVRSDLAHLAEQGVPDFADDEAMREHFGALDAVVGTLRDAITEHEPTYVESTSRTAYERASRLVWMVDRGREQFRAIHEGPGGEASPHQIRDSAMADQVRWLLRHEPPDRMALWAHNAHLTRGAFAGGAAAVDISAHTQGDGVASLGKHLARSGDIDYYALGLLPGGGTVRASAAGERGSRVYDIATAPDGSVPDVFSRVEAPLFFLDVGGIPTESPIPAWCASEPVRYIIAGGPGDSPVNTVEADVRRQFDGIVFVRETTPARPVSTDS